jgi:DNA repair exonuclease SbcCD ATPase subunit
LRSLQLEFENISEISKKINKNNLYKNQLKSIDLGLAKEFVNSNQIEDTSSLREAVGQCTSEIAYETKMIKKYSELGDICPTCDQTLEEGFSDYRIKEHTKIKDGLVEKVNALKSTIEKREEQNKIYRAMQQKIEDFEDLYRNIDHELPTEVPDAYEIEGKIEKIKFRIRRRREKVEEVIAENERRERHNTRIGIIEEQQTDFQEQAKELESTVNQQEEKLSYVEILKKAFSTNGLLAYKIENLVKDLEELTNDYLADLSDGRFSLQFVVSNDKLNVEIDDNGKTVDILALSAGELARVNTSTLLAIRKLMSSISKSRINVLFLDEVTNVLDEQGKERLVETLLGEENLNTYIVSHGWTHPLLSKIEVIKEDKISRLDGQS